MCTESGGVVDDLLVYALSDREFLLVVNASRRSEDLSWIERAACKFEVVSINDISDSKGMLALQGTGR